MEPTVAGRDGDCFEGLEPRSVFDQGALTTSRDEVCLLPGCTTTFESETRSSTGCEKPDTFCLRWSPKQKRLWTASAFALS